MKPNDKKNWTLNILAPVLFCLIFLSCSRQPGYPPAPLRGQDIVIAPAVLQPEAPKFYTYRYKGKNVNFFILKIQDKVLAFLDACVTCYPRKQGYRCESASVACRACGTKFSIFKLEKGIGGCYPIKIEGRMEKGEYRISRKTLENAADKF